jgi:hypothetical protein
MFIALATASAALSVPAQDTAVLEPAALHPSSATFVLQAPDIQAVLKAYSTTAPAKMIADPDLHASLGRVQGGEGAGPVDPWAMLMEQYEQAVTSGDIPPLLDYLYGMKSVGMSVEVAGGDVLAFVKGLEASNDQDFYVSQNFGLRLVVDFIDEASAEQVTQFLVKSINEESPKGLELSAKATNVPESAMGFGSTAVRTWSFVPSEAGNGANPDSFEGSMHIVAGGTRLAISAGSVEIESFVSALSSGAMDGAASSLFTEGRAAFEKAPATPVVEVFLRPFVEALVQSEEPDALPWLDVVEVMVGPAASFGIRGGHWRVGIDNGQFITEGLHDPSSTGPMSGVVGAQPLDKSALTLAHPSALVTSVTSLDAKALAQMVQELVEAEDPNGLSDMEENYGFRPDRDLIGSLGSALSYSLPQVKSLFMAPNLMGAALLNDKEQFTNGMDGLLRFAEDFGGDNIQLVRDEYKGAMMYTLSFTGELNLPLDGLPIDPASYLKPTVTIMDGRVLLTTLSTHAKKEVRRVLKLAKNGDDPGVHENITAMGNLNGATTVGYADWPTFLGAFYSQIKGLAPLLAGAMGDEFPFDVTMLPDATVLTRHFQPSENWTRMKDGRVMQYAKSSLGLEAVVMPFMGFALFGATNSARSSEVMTVQEIEAEIVDEAEESGASKVKDGSLGQAQRELTESTIIEVDLAITLYQLDHSGAAPATLAELTAKSTNYPDGYVTGGAIPKDSWGHDFVYAKTGDGYKLYSMGPNGQDDGGSGDDLQYP